MSTIEKALAKQKLAKIIAEKSVKESEKKPIKNSIEKAIEKQKLAKTIAEKSVEVIAEKPVEVIAEKPVEVVAEKPIKKPSSHHFTIQINGESLMNRGFLFDSTSRKETQEEFRSIKRKLINNAFGPTAKTLNKGNLIMVSSAGANEGKTFISLNLALSIALEQDKTVLLVDADVLRPSIHRELEFESKDGLLEYLLGNVSSIPDIIYNTSIPNLRIIPAGRPHHLNTELLASERMVQLTKELCERYPDRIVIFDCPPILGINETAVLSDLVGQAIIVVEESHTKVEDVKRAVSQLNEDIAVGFVMNKSVSAKRDVYGYYGYGYSKEK
jgi:protein-tyrosine kinase